MILDSPVERLVSSTRFMAIDFFSFETSHLLGQSATHPAGASN
jgi:hypothetical protein